MKFNVVNVSAYKHDRCDSHFWKKTLVHPEIQTSAAAILYYKCMWLPHSTQYTQQNKMTLISLH